MCIVRWRSRAKVQKCQTGNKKKKKKLKNMAHQVFYTIRGETTLRRGGTVGYICAFEGAPGRLCKRTRRF